MLDFTLIVSIFGLDADRLNRMGSAFDSVKEIRSFVKPEFEFP